MNVKKRVLGILFFLLLAFNLEILADENSSVRISKCNAKTDRKINRVGDFLSGYWMENYYQPEIYCDDLGFIGVNIKPRKDRKTVLDCLEKVKNQGYQCYQIEEYELRPSTLGARDQMVKYGVPAITAKICYGCVR